MSVAVNDSSSVFDRYGILFEENGQSLHVEIETDHLRLRSVQGTDLSGYQALYADPKTMQKFTDNEERLQKLGEDAWKAQQMESIAKRVALWVKRWNEEHDPFCAFVILRKDTGEMIGHIVAGHGDNPGESEIAYIIHERHWHKGYGTEAVKAIVLQYLAALKESNALVDGAPFTTIKATVRLDNLYSARILEGCGFVKVGEDEKWGSRRVIYCKA